MARDMGGSGYVITGIGGLVGTPASAVTLYAIVRATVDSTFRPILSLETSGGSSRMSFWLSNTNTIQLTIVASDKDTGVSASSSDGWMLVAVTKAAGSATPRGHKYVYSSNAWTHTDAAVSTGGDSGDLTGGRVQIGRYQTTSERWSGDIALAGVVKRALTDTEIEQLPFTLLGNLAVVPDALWLLDQSATTQTVLDLTGGGANETSLTSTSVSTQSVPLFNYGAGATMGVGRASAAGTQNADATLTATAAITAAGASTKPVDASLTNTATITPAAATTKPVDATLTATATATAAAASTKPATASPTITASITAAAAATKPVDAALTATATITASATVGAAPKNADAALSVTAAVTAAGAVTKPVQAALAATATITATATVTGRGMTGEAHGPLPVAPGAVVSNPVSIMGSIG